MKIRTLILLICCALWAAGASAASVQAGDQAPSEAKKPNILMISVDDLRPELNMFGAHGMVTPNLDRLAAAGGVIFQRAYCQYPVCGPSRASLMSGLRPTRERFVIDQRQPSIDQDAPGTLTISKYLKQNGYMTQALGKIYHYLQDNPEGWSLPVWVGVNHRHCNLEENREIMKNNKGQGPAFECADVPDEAYPDGLIALEAVRRIEVAANQDQPFFLAVGFWRPHLPFNAPKKYWDLYPAEEIDLADNPLFPEGVPAIALHNSPELLGYPGVPRPVHTMDENFARTLIRGYRACVSYIDANIGKLIDALERSGQAKNTVIVLWSDHGWHLGEHGMWGKESTFEQSLRTALMVVDLRVSRGGAETDALVELVDVYPTICELAGLPVPAHVEGTSFVPLLSDPSKPWKNAVFSCFVRPDQDKAGMSVRTDRWRYTEWRDAAGNVKGETLYDLKNDAEENMNLAGQPELRPVLQEMKEHLCKGWKAALPQP